MLLTALQLQNLVRTVLSIVVQVHSGIEVNIFAKISQVCHLSLRKGTLHSVH